MTNLKAKYMVYRVNSMVLDELMEKLEAYPENEELDAFADRVYEETWKSLDSLCEEMERFTGGEVDRKTARKLAICPKYSDRLESLMARWAA